MIPDDLPNGAALVSVTPSAGSCNETDPLSCSVGTIAAGGTVMLTLVLRAPSTAGSLPNVVSVTAVEGDRISGTTARRRPRRRLRICPAMRTATVDALDIIYLIDLIFG